jgi:hypothetical protein
MKAKSQERQERVAKALRENLKRRKARAKAAAGGGKSSAERPNKAAKTD